MKGIILAGGYGTRLYPLTISTSKQLLPIYNKPMIYYPLSTLMQAEIRDILIITRGIEQLRYFETLSKYNWGINITLKIQDDPKGLPEAFIIGEEFIGNDSVCMILGDNIFYGCGIEDILIHSIAQMDDLNGIESIVFGYKMKDVSKYAVVEFGSRGNVESIEEKPKNPRSSYCIPGIYFFDNTVIFRTKTLEPSQRRELEIVDLINTYRDDSLLHVQKLPNDTVWLDMGSHESLLQASNFVQTIEERTGNLVGSPLQVAKDKGWIE